jgi:putative endonuclease
MYFVYILRNNQNKLYIGQTTDLKSRIRRHNSGHGARFTKQSSDNFTMVYAEHFTTQLGAMKREKQLKGWTRAKKEALIANDIDLLKSL